MTLRSGLMLVLGGLLLVGAALLFGGNPGAEAQDTEPAGKAVFEAQKCNLCHGVPAAGIESKTKSEAMKGPDLGGRVEGDFEAIAAYVKKEAEKDGKSHKKEFKGSDEELQAILDWLGSLEAQK